MPDNTAFRNKADLPLYKNLPAKTEQNNGVKASRTAAQVRTTHPPSHKQYLCVILRSWDRASLMYSSITNKKQRYTVVFIALNALHFSGGSSAHHQEL
jgi:ribosome biogenesis protein Tsr3